MNTRAPGSPSDGSLAAELQQSVRSEVAALLGGATSVALVDFPYHRNAGDAAIWLGTRAVLDVLGVAVRYVADAGRYNASRLQEAVGTGPVLLQGGGNIGDLWPWSQGLRERVLTDLVGRTVIQLPQSIHFRDQRAEERFAAIVRAHGAYVLVTRDPASYATSARFEPAARVLAPDMAFGLGSVASRPPHGFSTDVLVLARDDVEQSSGLRAAAARARLPVADWDLGRTGDLRWQTRRLVPRAASFAVNHPAAWRAVAPVTARVLAAMSAQVLTSGLDLLASARLVVTDRLHAHILCVLLDVPHIVLDNSYGKISALHDQWTSRSTTTHFATDADEALDRALATVQRTS